MIQKVRARVKSIQYPMEGALAAQKWAYSDRKTIVTMVEEHRVEDVITAIRSVAAGSGTVSSGIIVISSVDDIL
jgi:nitrogen regulatory protein PII